MGLSESACVRACVCLHVYVCVYIDVDECSLGSSSSSLSRYQCPVNSHCNNTVGAYACLCDPGFTKNTLGQCEGEFRRMAIVRRRRTTRLEYHQAQHTNVDMVTQLCTDFDT